MIGNVWEWTTDWYREHNQIKQGSCCGSLVNPHGGDREASYDPQMPGVKIPRKVIKGGLSCVPPAIVVATVPQPAWSNLWTHPPVTWVFG
jgi:formylglycine-generating enzyme required for sulfatase activity